MAREFEVKYRLTPDAMEDIRKKYGPFAAITMETVYYDTPSGDFSARKWTLRRRLENGVSICALKTPGENGGRGEWEAACPDIAQALPMLVKAGAPEALLTLAKSGLHPLCAASFTRQAARICFRGSALELALDEGVLLGGPHKRTLLELEAELKEGREADALAFGEYLERTYGLRPEPDSKCKRAHSLAQERR